MIELIIFTNNASLENIDSPFTFKSAHNQVRNFQFFELNKIKVLFINDGKDFNYQQEIIKHNQFRVDSSTYIHLHESRQATYLQKWREMYDKANIVKDSHRKKEDNFYHVVIPKICDNTLQPEDLPKYFIDIDLKKVLNLFQKCTHFVPKKPNQLENLNKEIKALGCDVEFDPDNRHKSLEAIRRQLFQKLQ